MNMLLIVKVKFCVFIKCHIPPPLFFVLIVEVRMVSVF